jgi:hypothetical protein
LKRIQQILLFIGIGLYFFSCNTEDTICPEEQISQFRIAFNNTIDSTTNLYTLYITLPTDSGWVNDTIYNSSTTPGYIYLPVDITADSTWFFIDFSTITDSSSITVTDTISYTYTRIPILDNLECGFTMEFPIDTFYYTKHNLDTAILSNKQINSDNVNHVEIYY